MVAWDPAQAGLEGASVGICVQDLAERDPGSVPLYAFNENTLLMTASNLKILTAMYVLARLDPDARPETRVWRLSEDSVFVDAPGDPSLSLAQLAEARAKLGGGATPSSSAAAYVRQAYAPRRNGLWELSDLQGAYCTSVTALSLDGGAFELLSDLSGRVEDPPSYTGVAMERVPRAQSQPPPPPQVVSYDPVLRRLCVADGSATAAGERRQRVARLPLPAPDEAACAVLGFRLAGTPPHPGEPPRRTPDALLRGLPIRESIRLCLHNSDNNYAEHLLNMAARAHGERTLEPPLTPESLLRDWAIRALGVPPWTLKVSDGVGLRHSLSTASTLCRALVLAPPLLRDLLPGPGEGTLAGRLAGVDFRGKTGTVDGVASLSGYLRTRSGRDLAVSVVVNNANCAGAMAVMRGAIDRFVAACSDTL